MMNVIYFHVCTSMFVGDFDIFYFACVDLCSCGFVDFQVH